MDPVRRALDLAAFIDAAPSPFHACEAVAARLDGLGFRRLVETEPWEPVERGYVVRSGGLVAWARPSDRPGHAPFRVLGAHTDSPNLRVKPRPDSGNVGWRQLAVEVYGGVLLNSWLDRDLGLSGRVALRGARGEVTTRLLLADRPLLRVPQLAVHLDREVNVKGLVLDKQLHMNPVWSLGEPDEGGLARFVAAELDVDPADVLAFDLMAHDVQPSRLLGREEELLAAPRLDNLCSCYSALEAMAGWIEDGCPGEAAAVLCFFDHEEVGSTSDRGAGSAMLPVILHRVVAPGGGDDLDRAIAGSICASIDMAHATHPNYIDRHEPDHLIAIDGGPAIKVNTNMRYASDARTEAAFRAACERAGVPVQAYSHRSNLACGSTIGPITAANLGMPTVDVGVPQLSMHSARELCATREPDRMVRALRAFLDTSPNS